MYLLLAVLITLCSQCHAESVPQEALCRVTNKLGRFTNVGSGTLIDTSGAQGLVLTCAHLFAEGAGEIVVEFPGVKSHGARLVDLDRDADLAAVVIANPANTSAAVEFELNESDQLSACGFGPRGEYRCGTGPMVGEANSAGQQSILIGDAIRSGDSGGGVFDSQGRLVAVVWGEAAGITYASSGPPLRRFLDRVLGRRTATVYACPNGICPRSVPQSPAQDPRPPEPRQPQLPDVEKDQFDSLVERVDRLESENNSRHESLVERVAELAKASGTGRAAEAVTSLLGISGTTGWGVIAAGTVGGWLIGRLWKRRGAGGRRDEPFRNK
ncbi:S1 family peptidase [Bythopirellula polymerisocia]|uniref:Uncharacterized protein n=1 Tax=Bythopirellula polymerisocia TaxID=2528003 RepID=A0A5C6CZY4_9BACT|nr:serine protease [Bythopirellula polymerisocia]TWU30212.1 hypothetical protein Pla144_09980 [Bythopirellula polymerisocia]